MKRYTPCLELCDYTGEPDASMKEHPFGDWVRYEGHQQIVLDLQKAQERIRELEAKLQEHK
ncbi:hypothetical protein [Salmonella enterica]|uniref:hypothetical protein n=1 Tax=Salmonella enterica TaxID=28901 RepID=UPI003A806B62